MDNNKGFLQQAISKIAQVAQQRFSQPAGLQGGLVPQSAINQVGQAIQSLPQQFQAAGQLIGQGFQNLQAPQPNRVYTPATDNFGYKATQAILNPFANVQKFIVNPPMVNVSQNIQNPIVKFGAQLGEGIINQPAKSIQAAGRIGTDLREGTTTSSRLIGNTAEAAMFPLMFVGGAGTGKTLGQTAFKQGFQQAVKTGALEGAKQGAGFGLLQGLADNKDAASVPQQLLGAVPSTLMGGALGGVTGGIAGGISNFPKASIEASIKAVRPHWNEQQVSAAARSYLREDGTGRFAKAPVQLIGKTAGENRDIALGKGMIKVYGVEMPRTEFNNLKTDLSEYMNRGFARIPGNERSQVTVVRSEPTLKNRVQPKLASTDVLPGNTELTQMGPRLGSQQKVGRMPQSSLSLDNQVGSSGGSIPPVSGNAKIGFPPQDNSSSLLANASQKLDDIYTATLDRFHPLSKLSKKTGQGQAMENAITRYYGAGSTAEYHTNFELSPILKSVDDLNDFRSYLIAKRDLELAGRNIKGSDTNAAQQVLTDLSQKYGGDTTRLERASQSLYKYQNDLVKTYLVDTGIISKKAYESMISRNASYVPFQRIMDQVDGEILGIPVKRGAGSVGSQNIVKGIKGSDRQIFDPLESIVENTYKIVSVSRRNQVAKTIASASKDFPELVKKYRGSVGNRPSISVYENGKVQHYLVPPDVAEAAKGLSEETINTFVKIMSIPTKVLRSTATQDNPEFLLPNVMRDVPSAFVNAGMNPLRFISGMAHYIKQDKVYQQFLKEGGRTSRVRLDRPFLKTSVKQLSGKGVAFKDLGPLSLIQKLGDAFEQPTRIGAFEGRYNKLIKQGLPTNEAGVQAANIAQEATVNFARRGSKTQSINALKAFLNARAQGVDKLIRSVKNDPKGTTFRLGLITQVPAVLLYLHNRDFQSYNDPRIVPEYEKRNNYIFMLSDTPIQQLNGAQYVKIPKGDIGRFSNPTEAFLSYLDGKGDNKALFELGQAFMSLSPVSNLGDVIPDAIKPIAENAANYSFFTERPIVPDSKKNLPAPYQTSKSTAPIYNEIGRLTNQSPNQVQNLARGYLTGAARIGEMATTPFAKQDNYSGQDINRIPVIRRFLGGATRSEEEQQLNDMFKQKGVERQVDDIKTNIKHGNIPLEDGLNQINKLLNSTGKPLPTTSESQFGVKKADAAETAPLSPQDKLKLEVETYKAKQQVELSGKPQQVGSKLYYQNDSGNVVSVELDRKITPPQLTGLQELDKELISSYNSTINSKVNDIKKLYDLGKVSADEAAKQISQLNGEVLNMDKDGNVTKGPKAKKPKKIKITSRKAPAFKMPKSASIKIKQIKFKKIKTLKSSN